jgi:hypothetical protein
MRINFSTCSVSGNAKRPSTFSTRGGGLQPSQFGFQISNAPFALGKLAAHFGDIVTHRADSSRACRPG